MFLKKIRDERLNISVPWLTICYWCNLRYGLKGLADQCSRTCLYISPLVWHSRNSSPSIVCRIPMSLYFLINVLFCQVVDSVTLTFNLNWKKYFCIAQIIKGKINLASYEENYSPCVWYFALFRTYLFFHSYLIQ